ncbi:hypothetical protein HanPI659440_Chr08g0313901 [Helianthus annuus]|nr:hypothetical protein HanPI659440_Chr08g0313901 [Helianthus annuus]
MVPEMWYLELALGASKVHAYCNGRLMWRHTPWLGSNAAKGLLDLYVMLFRPVEGIMIAHLGRSIANLFWFGETAISHNNTFMQEAWTMEEVAFNVLGILIDLLYYIG